MGTQEKLDPQCKTCHMWVVRFDKNNQPYEYCVYSKICADIREITPNHDKEM